MKIVSNFKDYYDYVEYLYSPEGGDERLPFFRSKVDKTRDGNEGLVFNFAKVLGFPYVSFRSQYYHKGNMEKFPWRFKWCVVNGKYYLLVADAELNAFGAYCKSEAAYLSYKPYKLLKQQHPCFPHLASGTRWLSGGYNDRLSIEGAIGVHSDILVTLSKQVGSPIFTIREWSPNTVTVDNQIPNLGQLGFAALIPPEQMYQETAMFYGNTMRDTPDNNPPATVSDKDRLIQKGFDAKFSFRGKVR